MFQDPKDDAQEFVHGGSNDGHFRFFPSCQVGGQRREDGVATDCCYGWKEECAAEVSVAGLAHAGFSFYGAAGAMVARCYASEGGGLGTGLELFDGWEFRQNGGGGGDAYAWDGAKELGAFFEIQGLLDEEVNRFFELSDAAVEVANGGFDILKNGWVLGIAFQAVGFAGALIFASAKQAGKFLEVNLILGGRSPGFWRGFFDELCDQ